MKLLLVVFSVMMLGLFFTINPVLAQDAKDIEQACQGFASPAECSPGTLKTDSGFTKLLNTVVDVLSFVVGAAAIIMVIIGGLRYVVSNGDPQGTANAKNTILYAIVGLIITVAARAIILFILDRV